MTLVDTSILVRFLDPEPTLRSQATTAIARRLADSVPLCTCSQCLIEFWAVATRPHTVNGLGMSTVVALSELEGFEQMLTVLPEPDDIFERWKTLVSTHDIQGKAVHDARIAAFVGAYSITKILTLNEGDFLRYSELTVESR